MAIILNVGIVLIRSDSKVTTYSNNKCRSHAPLFKHTCPLFTQHVQSSRIISTSLLAYDEKEATEG